MRTRISNKDNMLKLLLALNLIVVIYAEGVTEEFIKSSIDQHNKYRRLHGSPDLVYNQSISEIAQAWADHLNVINFKKHNTEVLKEKGLGENISWMSILTKTGADHVDSLYTYEASLYDFLKACGKEPTAEQMKYFDYFGHYTQLVWKNTKSVGIGRAGPWVVYDYYPAGNIATQYGENVACPTAA